MNAKTYHILAATTTETIITAFDNDAAGQEATQSLVDFMKEHYLELDIDILEFPYNDLNEFLLRKGKAFFQKIIGQQLRQYTTSQSQGAS
jgi:DNA primase